MWNIHLHGKPGKTTDFDVHWPMLVYIHLYNECSQTQTKIGTRVTGGFPNRCYKNQQQKRATCSTWRWLMFCCLCSRINFFPFSLAMDNTFFIFIFLTLWESMGIYERLGDQWTIHCQRRAKTGSGFHQLWLGHCSKNQIPK